MTVAVALEGVVKRVGGRVVLSGATAAFRIGEMTLIRGGRGSGKTSLARLLSGATHPDAGRVRRIGWPAPIVGAAAGFAAAAPALRGLELRAAAYGLDSTAYVAAVTALMRDPQALRRDFGRVVGPDRTALLYGSAYLTLAPIYVADGALLAGDLALKAALAPLLAAARRRAAVIWIADEHANPAPHHPDRVLRLRDGAVHEDAAASVSAASAC